MTHFNHKGELSDHRLAWELELSKRYVSSLVWLKKDHEGQSVKN